MEHQGTYNFLFINKLFFNLYRLYMSLFTELQSFTEFITSIRKLEDYFSFDLQFPSKWSIPKSMLDEGNVLTFDLKDPNLKGISFVAKIEEKNINSIVDNINKVIKLNREREMKERLFKKMIENLKTTFESNSLDKLENLYFGFEENTILNLEKNEQTESESENVELVGESEEQGRDGDTDIQEENNKRGKNSQKREYVSET